MNIKKRTRRRHDGGQRGYERQDVLQVFGKYEKQDVIIMGSQIE